MRLSHFTTAALLGAMTTAPALASHNRGSVLIPTVSANGTLTIEATSFWRPSFVGNVGGVSITGPGGVNTFSSLGGFTQDTSDSRYTRVDETGTFALPTAGLYTISWLSCCRVSGIANAPDSDMGTTSTIFWDGSNATNPITFDIENIQPNVVRGSNYSDNLDVTSANGDTLSYDDTVLTVSITSQAPGFDISPTGQITIPGADTAAYADNPFGNDGADVAFSGQITATSAGGGVAATVQFDWLFDAVAQGANQVPDVADVVINAFVGDTINTVITGTDPNGDDVTLSLVSFNGPGGAVLNSIFTPGTPGNPTSGTLMWNSTGFGVGTYIASIFGTDGSLSDQGTITINLTNRPTPPVGAVPLPASMLLLGSALAGIGLMRRRRRT